MQTFRHWIGLGAVASSLLSGCTSTPSTNIKSTGIDARFSVDGANGAAIVAASATFKVGATYLDLQGGDEAYCEGVRMSGTSVIGAITYSATIPRKPTGESYTFELRRPGESPYVGTVVQLDTVSISSPANAATVSGAAPGSVTWNAGTRGSVDVSINGNCIFKQNTTLAADSTTYAFKNLDFTDSKNTSCDGTIEVIRNDKGTGPSGLSSSTVTLSERGTLQVKITP